MWRNLRSVIPLVLASLAACGKSTTAPASNNGGNGGNGGSGNTTTATYVGTIVSGVATGTFQASFTVPASSEVRGAQARREDVTASSRGVRIRGGSSASITITLLNGQTLTLTGSLTGTTFTVSDSNGDTCTGTLANALAATCTIYGAPVSLAGALSLLGAVVTTYCGFETGSAGAGVDASLLIGISDTNSFVGRIAAGTNAVSFYAGKAGKSTFVDTAVGTGNVDAFNGSFTSGTATGHDSSTSSHSVVGTWNAASPCQLYGAQASPTIVSFMAAAGNKPAPTSVTVTATGGASTSALGPITAVVTPPSATWLTATVSGDTVKLSASAQSVGGAYNATVNIYPQFGNAPLQVTVAYTVTGGSQPTGLWLGNSDGQLLEFTSLAGPTLSPSISTGTGGATGVGYLAVDKAGDLWMSSAFRGTVDKLPPANFSSGSPSLDITLFRPPDGASPQPTGIAFDANGTLWVADSANSGWFYGYNSAALSGTTPSPSNSYDLTSVVNGSSSTHVTPKLGALTFDAGGNLWMSDEATSLVYKVLAGQLNGSNLELEADGFMAVGGNGGSQPQSMAFDSKGNLWISFLGTSAGGTIFGYSAADVGNIQHNSAPVAFATVQITGVADSITSVAFDQSGNLWIVESARANISTALSMIPASSLVAGPHTVTPTVTYSATSMSQLPTSIAFDPPPTNIPMYAAPSPGAHSSGAVLSARSTRAPQTAARVPQMR